MSDGSWSRVKAIYRSGAYPCTGKQSMHRQHRAEWLGKISEPGVRRRAGVLLPAARCAKVIAAGSSARTAGGKQETAGMEKRSAQIPFDRSDPGGRVAGIRRPAPVSQQATAVGLRRSGIETTAVCRSPLRRRAVQRSKKPRIDRGLNQNLQITI